MAGKFVDVIFKGNAPGGFDGYGRIEAVGEAILAYYQKTGMYDIEVVGTVKAATVDSSNTVKEIKSYLDSKSISYTSAHDTKAKLLALINA